MKHFIINLIILPMMILQTSCHEQKQQSQTLPEPPIEKVTPEKDTVELDGTWGLVSYFDSIVRNKELAKYRLKSPPEFARLIEIKGDSLFSYGARFDGSSAFKRGADTLAKIETFEGMWHVIKRPNKLCLIKKPHKYFKDSTVYVYRKRDDLSILIDHSLPARQTTPGIIKFFNAEILAGSYVVKGTQRKVEFKPDGILLGLNGNDRYEIGDHFSINHPLGELDVVTLYRNETRNKTWDWWEWKFKGDTLILTSIYTNFNAGGRDWHLTDKKIVLVKK
jgi:hypothetical protein